MQKDMRFTDFLKSHTETHSCNLRQINVHIVILYKCKDILQYFK